MNSLTAHICQDAFLGVGDMRGAYTRLGTLPTSTNGDTFLIRSHIAYHCGLREAEAAVIKPSRGHSYRVVDRYGTARIVRISDHYDHREGVQGFLGA